MSLTPTPKRVGDAAAMSARIYDRVIGAMASTPVPPPPPHRKRPSGLAVRVNQSSTPPLTSPNGGKPKITSPFAESPPFSLRPPAPIGRPSPPASVAGTECSYGSAFTSLEREEEEEEDEFYSMRGSGGLASPASSASDEEDLKEGFEVPSLARRLSIATIGEVDRGVGDGESTPTAEVVGAEVFGLGGPQMALGRWLGVVSRFVGGASAGLSPGKVRS
ncbi:hypothetical protein HDU67_007614 [Dinochytrium kinnereticum]|nr:hypothetical protein HDU67_007614 [Dinochytrium kinnereticum]